MIAFSVKARSGSARTGAMETAHGVVDTPAFMPVGTQASVKALSPDEVSATGTRLLIANTYHLWLRPGPEVVHRLGGLHAFMRWPHAIVTDSGGYQAFSLAERARVSDDGFEFSSHLDGSRRMLSPEEAMRIQGLLGADVAMQLDVCPAANASRGEIVRAMELTTRWARRCLESRAAGQALFGIVQGGSDLDARISHARELAALPFDGLALGGFSVGEPPDVMHRVLRTLAPELDAARPRYLMGVGTLADLVRAIGAGIDLFDCVLPTRNARNGQAFLWRGGRISIRNSRHREDPSPLDPNCRCPACSGGYSRGYLRHLYAAGEILCHRLLTLHNLQVYADLTAEARRAIVEDRYEAWAHCRLDELNSAGEPEEGDS